MNFSRLDNAIDFLVKNDLIPFIELGFKPRRLMKTANLSLLEVDRENQFSSLEEMRQFFSSFIRHYINRYGVDEVEKWRFEYWRKLNVRVENGEYVRDFQSDKLEDYFREFAIIASSLRDILPEAKVGGGGFPVQHYGKAGLTNLFEQWEKEAVQPDFLSFTTYPYRIEQDRNIYYERRISEQFYMRNALKLVKQVMEEIDYPFRPVYVSEYGLTFSTRNPINDHMSKAANLVQTAISTIGGADLFGYHVGSDLYNEFFDSASLLFGSSGIMTHTGIRKPTFFCFGIYSPALSKHYFQK